MIKSKIASFQLLMSRHKIIEAFIIAFVLILAVFPDVIFKGASLRLTDQIQQHRQNAKKKTFYNLPNSTGWHAGYNDAGGAVFQSEPMIGFMRHSITTGQSPYWNPYSAAGSLGPETLVDLKFSAFTLIHSLLGNQSIVYTSVMLFLLYFSIFFMYRVAREKLDLSVLAGTGAAIIYLLNGYSAANFGSNVTQSYLYIPMCLFVSFHFIDVPKVTRFVAVAFSFAVFLSCTFIPTTVVSLIAIYALIIGYIFAKISQGKLNYSSGMSVFVLQGLAFILSILLLAFVYFPIFENIKSSGIIENYSKRTFYPILFPQSFASLFSSTHFFELYNAIEPGAWGINGNTVYHMSVIAIAFAGCCLTLQKGKYRPLAIASMVCIMLIFIRIFECKHVGFISKIPIIGHFGCQYWWAAIIVPSVILVGLGIDNLQRHNARILLAMFLLAGGLYTMLLVYNLFGLHEPHIFYKFSGLLLFAVLTAIMISVLISIRFTKNIILSSSVLYCLVGGMFVELMVHSKMLRHRKNEFFTTPPPAIEYVRKNVGLYRTLNFSSLGLYPELGAAFQIQEITSMNPGVLPSYRAFFDSAIHLNADHGGEFPTLRVIKDTPQDHKINWNDINLLGVKYIILPSHYVAYKEELLKQGMKLVYETPAELLWSLSSVFENPYVLPRSFSVALHNNNEIHQSMNLPKDFHHHIHESQITSYKNTEVEISDTALTRTLVVLTDNWHKNWRATVNGVETPIIKINGTFRGVIVPPGNYTIKMNYLPRTLLWAMGISFGVFLMLITMILLRRRLDEFCRQRLSFWG